MDYPHLAGGGIYMLSMREVIVMTSAAGLKREGEFFSQVNAAGVAFNGKNWKWMKPNRIPSDFEDREKRALERHNERRRKRWHSESAVQ